MFNDHPLVPTEEALAMLRRKRGAPGSARGAPERPKRPVKARKARAGEVRAIRVLERLTAAAGDPGMAIDVRRSLERSSEAARRYAALLMTDGAMDDTRAARALGIEPAGLAREADAWPLPWSPDSAGHRRCEALDAGGWPALSPGPSCVDLPVAGC